MKYTDMSVHLRLWLISNQMSYIIRVDNYPEEIKLETNEISIFFHNRRSQ